LAHSNRSRNRINTSSASLLQWRLRGLSKIKKEMLAKSNKTLAGQSKSQALAITT